LVFENIPSFEFLFKGQKVIEFFGCERTVDENSAKTEALKVGNIPLYNSIPFEVFIFLFLLLIIGFIIYIVL
jgi:hypothetical protein